MSPETKKRYCGSKRPHDPHVWEGMVLGPTVFFACKGKAHPFMGLGTVGP